MVSSADFVKSETADVCNEFQLPIHLMPPPSPLLFMTQEHDTL